MGRREDEQQPQPGSFQDQTFQQIRRELVHGSLTLPIRLQPRPEPQEAGYCLPQDYQSHMQGSKLNCGKQLLRSNCLNVITEGPVRQPQQLSPHSVSAQGPGR